MERERYLADSNESHTLFEFTSKGVKGNIKKIVTYQHWGGNVYNLAFGDYDNKIGWLNDTSRSNNGDADKVLATVAYTVIIFLQHYPDAKISIQGSTVARTRLYQMQLVLQIKEISSQYIVEAHINGDWEIFRKGKNYDGFSIRNKK